MRKALLAGTLMLAAACTAKEVPYIDSISEWRATKDQFMQRSPDSPIPPDQRASFPPLTYFPIEPEYRIPASLAVARTDEVIEIPTSRGERRPHNRVGQLSFTLKGRLLTLTAFVEVGQQDMSHLFVPFGDLTNGTETYPGGRYLELDRYADGHLRSRLQPRVSPVLLLQPEVRLPVSAARKPATHSHPVWRAHESLGTLTRPS